MDGPKSLERYLALFNGRHVPPATDRCPRRQHVAIQKYIDSWHDSWLNTVKNYADRIHPLRDTVRVIGLIPARNEEFRIRACLSAIGHDVASSRMEDAFDLIILENGQSNEVGATATSVSEWIEENKPTFPIHMLQQNWLKKEKYPLAKARKLLADIAIYRISEVRPNHTVYLLSEDADIERIQTGRMRMALTRLDKQPSIDAIRGIQERSIYAMKQNHLALLERRSWQFTELVLSSHHLRPPQVDIANFYWNRVVTAGSNVFFSAEIYGQIGGYSEDVVVFEDMDIGQRISVLRGQYSKGQFVPCMSTVCRFVGREESSFARILLSLIQKSHVYQHDGSEFFDVDHIIKRPGAVSLLLAELLPYAELTEDNKWRFENLLADSLSELHRICNADVASKLFRRIMFYLGFSPGTYVITSKGAIRIKAARGFLQLANRFVKQTSKLRRPL